MPSPSSAAPSSAPRAPARSISWSAAWFLGRAAWRRRWVGLIGLGLLAGIVGGVVIGSIGGIRRSSTAFERLLDTSRFAPYLIMSPVLAELGVDFPAVLAAQPGVQTAVPSRKFIGRDDRDKDWWAVSAYGSDDTFQPVIVEGRNLAPDAPDEVIVSVNTARLHGLHVGGTRKIDFYTNAEMQAINSDSWTPPTGPSPALRVVGIYRDPLDAARSGTATSIRAGQAFIDAYGAESGIDYVDVRMAPGRTTEDLDAAIAASNDSVGLDESPAATPAADRWIDVAATAERRSRQVILAGLGSFAAVALLAGVVAHGQSLRRWAHPVEADQAGLSAMGATVAERRLAVVLGLAPHLLVALPIALLVAYLSSAIFPFGVLADIEPAPGLRADLALFAAGAALMAVLLAGLSWFVADNVVRGRRPRRRAGAPGRMSVAESAGVPVPATVGVRFVLRPGSSHRALPVRTALVAAVLAIAGVTAAVVFTSSLDRLVAEPARYGNSWDLNLELLSSPDGQAALDRLVADPDVADIDTPSTLNVQLLVAGRPTQVTAMQPVKGRMQLEVSSGRPPSGPQEIVLGPELLEDAGLQLGDDVEVVGADQRTRQQFTVVGTALSLANGTDTYQREAFFSDEVDTALVPWDDRTLSFPMAAIRFAPGVDVAAKSSEIDAAYPYALMNESVPRPPAEIVNIAQLDVLPRLLAGFLAFLGIAALVHALVVTVRSRRYDLGILRTLGFTRAQSAATIVAMTSTIVLIGIAVGVPLGLVVGASGWRMVAQRVYVATDSLMPFLWISLAALVALVAANLVSLLPARAAARQAPIESLRVE